MKFLGRDLDEKEPTLKNFATVALAREAASGRAAMIE